VSQLVSLVFVVDYPSRWPGFFPDLVAVLGLGHGGADMYLRTLDQIHLDVVDRDIAHTLQVRVRLRFFSLNDVMPPFSYYKCRLAFVIEVKTF